MVLTLKLIGMAMSYQDYNSKKPEVGCMQHNRVYTCSSTSTNSSM